MTRTRASSSSRRSKPTTDLKWLAHLALKNLSVGRNQPGHPAPKRKGTSKKVETRNFRQLTQKRKRMVEEFMTEFKANPAAIGKYGSNPWINALIRHLNDTRFGIIPLDIHNWLVNESYFNKHNRTYDFDPCNCSNIVIASSEDSSSHTDSIDQRMVKTEAENGVDEEVEEGDIGADYDGADVKDMMPNGTAAVGVFPVEPWEIEDGRRHQQAGIAEDQDKSNEKPASPVGQADMGNVTDKIPVANSTTEKDASHANLEATTHSPPEENLDNSVSVVQSFQEYIDASFNFISTLRLQSGQDSRINFTLDCFYNLMSLTQRVLDHATKEG